MAECRNHTPFQPKLVQSLLSEYPLGLLYFVKAAEDKYEVLDGQQRITSFGRFVTGKFAIPGC